MTGAHDSRFPKSLTRADRILTDVKWDLSENGGTPFSDFFGFATLTASRSGVALRTRRPTPLSSILHLPTVWRRRPRLRLRTGRRFLSWR